MQILEIANLRKSYVSPDGAHGKLIAGILTPDGHLYGRYRLKAGAVPTRKGIIE